MTIYSSEAIENMINRILEKESDPLTREGLAYDILEVTGSEIIYELLESQDALFALAHRIRDLEAELEKYVNRNTVR